jgi:hypothetical protein
MLGGNYALKSDTDKILTCESVLVFSFLFIVCLFNDVLNSSRDTASNVTITEKCFGRMWK